MQRDLLIKKIESIEKNEVRFAKQLRSKPGLALKVVHLLLLLLQIMRDYAYDDNGNRKKIKWYHFIIKRELRRALWKLIAKVDDLFDESQNSTFTG
jgi:hypothetical protein